MTVDIRAICSCSLGGELISASISDDFFDGSGLIKSKGICVLKGASIPKVGSQVTFKYSGHAGSETVPRLLYVIGGSTNPFTRITTVTLGCYLTLVQDFHEDLRIDASGDPVTEEEYTDADAELVTIPIKAEFIAQYCAKKLGISGAPPVATYSPGLDLPISFGLESKFSIAAFDLSPGYYQVLSDLLASECKVGFMGTGKFELVDLNKLPLDGAHISDSTLIDVSPIGMGIPFPDQYSVTYSTLKLVKPDTTDEQALKWEKDESYGLFTKISIPNPMYETLPTNDTYHAPRNFEYTYVPKTIAITKYDTLNRVVSRETTEYTILAAVAPSFVQYMAPNSYGESLAPNATSRYYYAPPYGNIEYTIVTTELFTYTYPAPEHEGPKAKYLRANPPEGYEEVKSHETFVEEPMNKLVASTQIYDWAAEATYLNHPYDYYYPNSLRFIAEKTIETSDYGAEINGTQITKTFYDRYKCFGYTQEGQQALASAIYKSRDGQNFFPNGANEVLAEQFRTKYQGRETNISTGYKIGLQQRPATADRSNLKNSKGGASNYRVERKSESILVGSGKSKTPFSLPYAPDDIIRKISEGPPPEYEVIKAKPSAEAVARAYGKVQNRIKAGAAYGMNIQCVASAMPSKFLQGIALSAGGATGAFVTNGTTWTLSSDGVVASTDALFMGGLGGGS